MESREINSAPEGGMALGGKGKKIAPRIWKGTAFTDPGWGSQPAANLPGPTLIEEKGAGRLGRLVAGPLTNYARTVRRMAH